MAYALSLAVGLFVSMALIPPLARLAGKLKLEDIPDSRKVHTHPIPRIGGIAVIAGLLTAITLWVPLAPWISGFLVGALILAVFGVWDDRSDLDYRMKFVGQFAAATVAVIGGGIEITRVPLLDTLMLPSIVAAPLTIVVLVAITNAINLSDGLDGLAGGTTLLAVGCIAVLAYGYGDQVLATISFGMIGAILGFLRFNSYPARVFLGDTGSQFLGYSAAVLAIVLTQKSNVTLSAVLPLYLLGLPVLDTVLVMTQRILEGRSPFKPDRNHIHHRLLAVGFDHYEAVVAIYVAQTLLVSGAFFLRYESDTLLLGAFLLFAAATLGPLLLAQQRGWSLRVEHPGHPRQLARLAKFLGRYQWLQRSAVHVLGAGVPSVLAASWVLSPAISLDLGAVAVVCLCAAAASWGGIGRGVFDRLAVYVTAAMAAFVIDSQGGALAEQLRPVWIAVYGALAASVAVLLRFAGPQTFRVSPLDFLVIVMVVLVAYFAGTAGEPAPVVRIALQVAILFYACEMLRAHSGPYWLLAQGTAFATLSIYAIRSVL